MERFSTCRDHAMQPCSAHTIVRALAHLDNAPGMDFVLVEAWLFSSAKPVASDTLLSAS